MIIEVNRRQMGFLECFSSATRVTIIELLNEQSMNIKEIAAHLGISSAIVTKHIQKLQESGIVKCESVAGIRGMQKRCTLALDEVVLQFHRKKQEENRLTTSIPVGQYSSYSIKPTCGLASVTQLIGMMDDPRYFASPNHVEANHLWFRSGFVEYRIPNYLLSNQTAESLELSLEICSESPYYNENWPSDITFYINNVCLGYWTSPGDFGAQKGHYTPEWFRIGSEYGQLKTITVNENGSYIDGMLLSETRISDLGIRYGSEILFKLASLEDSTNCGGVNLFGKKCGNYDQDLLVTLTTASKRK